MSEKKLLDRLMPQLIRAIVYGGVLILLLDMVVYTVVRFASLIVAANPLYSLPHATRMGLWMLAIALSFVIVQRFIGKIRELELERDAHRARELEDPKSWDAHLRPATEEDYDPLDIPAYMRRDRNGKVTLERRTPSNLRQWQLDRNI